MRPGWRLEWRDPADAGRFPDLALCRDFLAAEALAAAAAALHASGAAADGEFHVALLDLHGRARTRVLAGAAAIAAWHPDAADLPEELDSSRWGADLERQTQAARAVETVRSSMRAAWRAGAIGTPEAMRLVAEASRLLDPDVDDDDHAGG